MANIDMILSEEECEDFIRKLVSFQERTILGMFQASEDVNMCASEWEIMQRQLEIYRQNGCLAVPLRQVAVAVAQNIKSTASFTIFLERKHITEIALLKRELDNLVLDSRHAISPIRSHGPRSPRPLPLPTDASIAPWNEDTRWLLPTSFPDCTPADHLRFWFLDHLANPYPTPPEKEHLSRLTGIARNKIDSDMTNWRRRAGWTDIKEKWAKGSKAEMVALIARVEIGEEKRRAVNEAVEKMKAYLERREEYGVGSWVHQLKTMARDRLDETPRKKARVEGKKKIERPNTPPLSTNSTPTSSVYSTRSFTSSDPSPAGSSRSTSSSSSISTSYSFNDFKPYSFEPSASWPISTSPLSPLSSTAGTVAGVKRENDFGDHMSSNTRRKLESVSPVIDQLPSWSTPVCAEWYPDELYVPPLSEPIAPIVWTASAPLPEYLPHMTATPPQLPAFTLPDQHDFVFSVPTSEARHMA